MKTDEIQGNDEQLPEPYESIRRQRCEEVDKVDRGFHKPRIIVCGNYGAENLGDELILAGILRQIREISPKAEITVLSANPTQTAQKYQVTSLPHFPAGLRSLLRKTKTDLADTDFFILGGGGLFASLTFRANIIWAIQAFHALRRKIPLIIYGQSLENLRNPLTKLIVKAIFRRAKLIAMRDQKSRDLLAEIGIRSTHLIPDPALHPEPSSFLVSSSLAIFALRGNCKMANHPDFATHIQKAIKKLQNPHFLAFQPNEDLPLQTKIANLPETTYEDLPKAKIIIAMRLHSIISAINYGIPFLALAYSPKVTNFLKNAGLENLITKPKDLANRLENFNHEAAQQQIAAYQKRLAPEIAEAKELLRRHLTL